MCQSGSCWRKGVQRLGLPVGCRNSNFMLNSSACCVTSSNTAWYRRICGEHKGLHLGSGIWKTKMMSKAEVLEFLTQEGMVLKSWVLGWKLETKEMKKKDVQRVIRLSVMKKLKKTLVRMQNQQHLWGPGPYSQTTPCDLVIFVSGSTRSANNWDRVHEKEEIVDWLESFFIKW